MKSNASGLDLDGRHRGGKARFGAGRLLFVKTVKTPGAFATVTVPQRLGVLSPSRRICSTLTVVE
jgi:hypothetical protein